MRNIMRLDLTQLNTARYLDHETKLQMVLDFEPERRAELPYLGKVLFRVKMITEYT